MQNLRCMLKMRYIVILFLLLLIVIPSSISKAGTNKEYMVKAGFIYQFTKFIKWKGENIKRDRNKNICIFGNTGSFGAINGKKSYDKTINLLLVNKNNFENARCHILFISKEDDITNMEMIERLNEPETLIISDGQPEFKDIVGINFINVGPNIRFEINIKGIQNKKLVISSELLKLAQSTVD